MKLGSIYEKVTGRIVMTVVAPDQEGVEMQIAGSDKLAILFDKEVDGRNFYILDGVVTDRPRMSLLVRKQSDSSCAEVTEDETQIILLQNEQFRITNIPAKSVVRHPGGEALVNDGFVEWSAAERGSYEFEISNFPYREVKINAVVG